jgi:hypothetical protein
MNKCLLWLVLLAVLPARAQISVEVTQEQDSFLPGESLPVAVRITNLSGQTLRLGGESNWLTFTVETADGKTTERVCDPSVMGEFELANGKIATRRVDLSPCQAPDRIGRYILLATLRIPNWDKDVVSQPKSFDIIDGIKLWEQIVGIPKAGGETNGVPELRRYTLLQTDQFHGRMRLYLRVTESPGNRIIRTVVIGPMHSFSRPEPQLDKTSNLHLLYADGPHSCSYTVFEPDGELILRQTHDFGETRPKLRMDDQGNFAVTGGIRRVTSRDVPVQKTDDAEPAKP